MGSRDRRTTSALIYNYFRVTTALTKLTHLERLAIGCFLCEREKTPLYEYLLNNHSALLPDDISLSLTEKLERLSNKYSQFHFQGLFPFDISLSSDLEKNAFQKSMLIQPLVWIRIRKHQKERVEAELSEKGIKPVCEDSGSLGFQPGTKLEDLNTFRDGSFEIQDLSSQQTGSFFKPQANEYWWDVCAGAGGKSLVLLEQEGSVRLTATDVRPTILENYKKRLEKAGWKRFNLFCLDAASAPDLKKINKQFDGIITDVPCSGSGTWSRTPEMHSIFRESQLKAYSEKQKTIAANASDFLKPGQPLIYCTCSVFKAENEDVVQYLIAHKNMKLESAQLFCGYEKQADTLFAARLIKA